MIVDKLSKRVKIKVPIIWNEKQKSIKSEVLSNADMILHNLLEDADIVAGDDMTIDVKVLIERK